MTTKLISPDFPGAYAPSGKGRSWERKKRAEEIKQRTGKEVEIVRLNEALQELKYELAEMREEEEEE